MKNVKDTSIKNYTYSLPASHIAAYPLPNRTASKLLLYKNGTITNHHFYDVANILSANDVLINNQSKVMAARFFFKTKANIQIEIFCLEPFYPAEINANLQTNTSVSWKCMIGKSSKWKPSETLTLSLPFVTLSASKKTQQNDAWIIEFSWNNTAINFAQIMDACGHVPLPPYLNRSDEEADKSNYQTVYAIDEGSVAAPTAGLHFDNKLLDELKNKGIYFCPVTLHVGAGTFLPVKAETMQMHQMHSERFEVDIDTLIKIKNATGNRIAVGTTSLRTLESMYWIGEQLSKNKDANVSEFEIKQWQPYENTASITSHEALENIINWLQKKQLKTLIGKTSLLILPGYNFKFADALITNFHQPNSTLLLLVAAFIGKDWQKIYEHALQNNYRFLSFGDSSLLYKNNSIL
ncbi:MAG: hypothetical protein RL708_359 [Bacteroidota bacterium]|jgi:S-adenosylmethionine:tRNA ribosyltransferase-isomerase